MRNKLMDLQYALLWIIKIKSRENPTLIAFHKL